MELNTFMLLKMHAMGVESKHLTTEPYDSSFSYCTLLSFPTQLYLKVVDRNSTSSTVRQTILANQTKGTLALGNLYHAQYTFLALAWLEEVSFGTVRLHMQEHKHVGHQVDIKYNHAITPPCIIKKSKNVRMVFMTKTTQNKPRRSSRVVLHLLRAGYDVMTYV